MNTSTWTRRAFALLITLAAIGTAALAQAHGYRVGDLVIDHPHAAPSLQGAVNGGGYVRGIRNEGKVTDRLVGASSPVAQRVELHVMRMEGEVMRMREVETIELPPGQTVALRPGQGHHLMLMNLQRPLVEGERFDITLRFERAGEITVQMHVQKPGEAGGHGQGHGHRH